MKQCKPIIKGGCGKKKPLDHFARVARLSKERRALCKRCTYLKAKHKMSVDEDLFREYLKLVWKREWKSIELVTQCI